MEFDRIISNVRVEGHAGLVEIGILGESIAAIAPNLGSPAPREDGRRAFAFGGFVESHIHLDKACILDRCPICDGTLQEAISLSAAAKRNFTVDDVYRRAARVVEMAILQGTTRLRSFVEVDPRAGLRSFEALASVKADYAHAIDIELCAFAQDGINNEPETLQMLEKALNLGADLVGGCPYSDPDPNLHVKLLFDLAERHGVRLDFHADFDLDPQHSSLPEIARQTSARGMEGRVTVGHVTKLSAMAPDVVDALGELLAKSGIGVTVLPATDLFLLGRDADRMVPRGLAPAARLQAHGVLVTIASNNILNPFTPFGDASLNRMANLYANVAQLAGDEDLDRVFAMVSTDAARLLGHDQRLAPGADADIVLIDAACGAEAVRCIAPVLAGWKRGRKTFHRERAVLFFRPTSGDR